ncbi:hypothetical protein [Cloacibacillus sp.]|uniref:hypothetical protein n=1 Tax=Cloacibacillus sp. TaxID=2049023 RepID=UPI0025C632E0|nr:hypothetical protein [Cloacibacillus sp.]MCC8056444.1 hypothetical protein [Cloacibacillus sp.]
MKTIAAAEYPQVKGRLVFRVIRDGQIIHTGKDNLIVTSGRNALAKLLSGQTGMHIAQVGVGTGGSPTDASDTGITGAVKVNVSEARVGVGLEAEDGTIFDDPRVVQFHFVFGIDTAVGMDIAEYGLFCADGSLFSRVIREKPLPKSNTDKIIGFWQITF